MASSKEVPKEDFNQGLMDAMARGIASGVGNFFSNMWIAAGRFQEDFLGFDDYDGSRAIQNVDDDIRFVKAVTYIAENFDTLIQIVGMIIEDTMSKLSYEQRERVGEASLKGYTSLAVGMIVTGGITARVVQEISNMLVKQLVITGFWKFITGWVVKGALVTIPIQALLSRASDASRMLKYQNPELYNKLYPMGGDMLYFIFEPVVQYINEY